MKENKKDILLSTILVTLITIFVAFVFWPEKYINESNEIDKNKLQMKVLENRLNIREQPSIN